VPLSPAALGLSLLAVTVLLAGGCAWFLLLLKLALSRRWIPQPAAASIAEALSAIGISRDLPLVPFAPRRAVPWGLFDLIALVAIWLIGLVAGSIAMRQAGWLQETKGVAELTLSEQQTVIAGNLAISVLIIAIGLPLIALRSGARLSDFGWSPRHILTDVRLGLIGFVMLAPPVYAVQGLLVQFWQPSKHPLVEMFQSSPDPRFFALLFVAAAVVAPLFEELVFRVLLQGFLEEAFRFHGEVHELFFGTAHRPPLQPSDQTSETAIPLSDPGLNPYAPPQTLASESSSIPICDPDAEQPELRGPAAWLPIAISSIVFALMHYSHGPDWIPLTFLAAGMGYLYQRTHRLLPSLVVHVLVNCSSMLALWVQVFDSAARGG
jgi:membrane protease YdiL (CAAX protease family)